MKKQKTSVGELGNTWEYIIGCSHYRIQYGNALKIMFLYNPAIPLLSIFPKELKAKAQRHICIPMLIAALFIIPQKWKQPGIHPWMNG